MTSKSNIIKRPLSNKSNSKIINPNVIIEKNLKIMEDKLKDLKLTLNTETENRISQERWKPSLENNKKNSFEKKINEIKAENKINPIKNLKKESILLENQKRKNFSNKSNQLAENNLNKALKLQKQIKNVEIIEFFTSINLQQYIDIFIDNGFDDLETLKEINVENLNMMNIRANHQQKITDKLKIISSSNNSFGVQTSINSNSINIEKKQKSKNNDLDENLLKNGVFDEQKSHESFLEALNAFRNTKQEIDDTNKIKINEENEKPIKRKSKEKKKVTFIEKPAFSLINNNENNVWTNIDLTNFTNEIKLEKYSCWECFKVNTIPAEFTLEKRLFCSKECYLKYETNNKVKCINCNSDIYKFNSKFSEKGYYCNEMCKISIIPQMEEIELFITERNIQKNLDFLL